jgi:Tol biopolymer transport system component
MNTETKPEAWSQDSKWIVATTFGLAAAGSLIRISVETGERSQLSSENDVTFASISPDNRKLLYVRNDRGQVRFMVPLLCPPQDRNRTTCQMLMNGAPS